ncbi:sigma-70 family RNA polymerase sigma factor [Aeromicrobium sp.]|uniref:sigma-70 family RNA polymerase sigma factor n=1 Tax=Aeromicrobium sp. TaxID=1871063 RepID=UPI0030BE4C3A
MSNTRRAELESSDAELIGAVRDGGTEAYGELFGRHRDAATRLARQLVRGPDADDLVAEAFVRVLTVLQSGRGPDEFFRAYLLSSIRRLHIDRVRHEKRVIPTADDDALDRTVEFVDPAEMRFDQRAAAEAYASLPERWQLVLWHLDVEGHKPADIAPLLGMSANSVSALAYRAREGLRQAYLQGQLAPSLHASCRTAIGMLGAYVRKGLSHRDTVRVESHLDECTRCTGLQLELSEINSHLSGILGPALLGSLAGGYLSGSGAAALAGTGAAVGSKGVIGTAIESVLAPVKIVGATAAGASTQGIAAVAVVIAVAAVGTVAVTADRGAPAREEPRVSGSRDSPAPTTPAPTTSEPTQARPEPTVTAPAQTPSPTTSPDPDPVKPNLEVTPPRAELPEPLGSGTGIAVRPSQPTDYAISAVQITRESFLQRLFEITIRADNPGRAKPQTVTVMLAFDHRVRFRGALSAAWDCGPVVRNQSLRTLSCSRRLDAGEGTTFDFRVRGLESSGTVTVSAVDDPVADNNSVTFGPGPGLWPTA